MNKLIVLFISLVIAGSACQRTEISTRNMKTENKTVVKNVLGTDLMSCCTSPVTGFYRNGLCHTGPEDYGTHIICAELTTAFLEYSKAQGNDLMTPLPDRNFPGLVEGDKWCLCISRWLEAEKAGVAPLVDLEATHEKALGYVSLEVLKRYGKSNNK